MKRKSTIKVIVSAKIHLLNCPLLLLLLLAMSLPVLAQQQPSPWDRIAARPSTLGIEKGTTSYAQEPFILKLVNSSQTVAGLTLATEPDFDYTPSDRLHIRDKDSLYHLGDINLRIRAAHTTQWTNLSTAKKRAAILPLPSTPAYIAAADLSNSLPHNSYIKITRYWEKINDGVQLRFEITNSSTAVQEIGALGIPLIFNNILQDKTLDQAHKHNVFFDPYIGAEAGYLQVNRLHGNGVSLLVLPGENASFEAYNPLNDDLSPRSIVFEGFHEWLIHSKAYADNEWKGVEQWNTPTSVFLQPGEKKSYALRFILSPSIKAIETTLSNQQLPVAIGLPGYVLSQQTTGRLQLRYKEPVKSIDVFPTGAVTVKKGKVTGGGWLTYHVEGKKRGRARVTVTYRNGKKQTIHYKIIKPETEVINSLGQFLTTAQWYENAADPFKRSPSVITYDYETKQPVTQERRAWFAGLSDEAGAGSWLAAIMKQYLQPDKEELQKLKRFVHETMFGRIQHSEGPKKYAVVKSLFYYAPDSMPAGTYDTSINWKTWSAWPKKEADNTGRSYNYPHVAAAHWVMYRLARNYVGLVTEFSWKSYLENAFHTAIAMTKFAPYYAQFGQMEGSVFLLILKDLKKEGLTVLAQELEDAMRKRADHWRKLNYPFGSEMPWDSTGQEEVYMWSRYFGYADKAAITLNAILAYMPTVPHWGYNGSARRYWDFVYGGKLSRIERQLHHYGSALNAVPVITSYKDNPDDSYLLRVGHAGTLGALANITDEGFAPAAFHSYPSTLAIDGISGDYGSGFYGYAVNSATFITQHPEFGWLAFSGNLTQKGNWINTKVTTGGKSKIFLAPAGLWIQLESGMFDNIAYNTKTGEVKLTLLPANDYTPTAYLRVENSKGEPTAYKINNYTKDSRGIYSIALASKNTTVALNK